jgi:response regulator RpfG family c-di-GMP phosphodiesterase
VGTTLEEILVARPSGKRLISDLDRIREKAESLLSRIPQTFPEYTEHGISHSKRVIESLNRNLSDSVKKILNENEIYFLLASAYLHDVGMVDFTECLVEQTRRELESNWFKTA